MDDLQRQRLVDDYRRREWQRKRVGAACSGGECRRCTCRTCLDRRANLRRQPGRGAAARLNTCTGAESCTTDAVAKPCAGTFAKSAGANAVTKSSTHAGATAHADSGTDAGTDSSAHSRSRTDAGSSTDPGTSALNGTSAVSQSCAGTSRPDESGEWQQQRGREGERKGQREGQRQRKGQ